MEGEEMGRPEDSLTEAVIGACIEVHRCLGPGLLESTYEACLCHELALRGLSFKRQHPVPLGYKGIQLDCGYRLDLVVEDYAIIEVKAVSNLQPLHTAQLITYLKLSGLEAGLLINFNVPYLRQGIRRIVIK